jgi:hypothetical protein
MVELKGLVELTRKLDISFAKDFVEKNDSAMLRMKAFQNVIDNIDNYVSVVTPDLKLYMINKKMEKMLKDRLNLNVKIGESAYKQLYNLDCPPEWDPFMPAIVHRRVTIREFISPSTKRKYGIIAIPLIYNGVSAVIGIATDEDSI